MARAEPIFCLEVLNDVFLAERFDGARIVTGAILHVLIFVQEAAIEYPANVELYSGQEQSHGANRGADVRPSCDEKLDVRDSVLDRGVKFLSHVILQARPSDWEMNGPTIGARPERPVKDVCWLNLVVWLNRHAHAHCVSSTFVNGELNIMFRCIWCERPVRRRDVAVPYKYSRVGAMSMWKCVHRRDRVNPLTLKDP